MQATETQIKEDVRKRYTAAVTRGGGCCGGGGGGGGDTVSCGGVIPRGRVVAVAGYDEKELNSLPADAVANSFGCGNPLAFAGVIPGQVVVDIGSGAGIDCLLAGQKVGDKGRVIGIDMTPVMIERARENARKAGATNVEFRLGEAESMPVDDGTADWIISNCVINLSPDKPRVFREAYRVLRPGGRLSVSDIMVEELPWILRRSRALYSSCVSGAIPEARYLDGLRSAGFRKVEVIERIVYDRDQILGLLREIGLVSWMYRLIERPTIALLDRYIIGKVWSAKVVAEK